MSGKLLTLCCTLAFAGFVLPVDTLAGCKGCDQIKASGEGFCDHCNAGSIFGVKLKNRAVYDLLAGDSAKFEKAQHSKCAGCASAAKNNGQCRHCNVFVADGKVFKTAAAQAIAKGTPVTAEMKTRMASCKSCTSQLAHDGYCTGCSVGFVANRMFKNKTDYDAAQKAHALVAHVAKDASPCKGCLKAQLSNSSCAHCNVSFIDGKPVKG